MKKLFKALMCMALLTVFIIPQSGCSQADSASADAGAAAVTQAPANESLYPRIITDMAGREAVIDKEVTKIVVLFPADCEILYAIGAGDTVIGRGEYCDYPSEALSLPQVQSGFETNIEQIIALMPDAVVMTVMDQSAEHVNMLADAGITVIVTDASDIAGIYTAVELLGQLTGRDAEAAGLIEELKAGFAGITSEKTGKTVYFEVSPLEWGLWTAGAGTFMDEVAGMAGLTNIFADIDGWAEISQEQVIDKNPDYIVTVSMYDGQGQSPVDEIKSRAGWEGLSAVINDNVFILDSDEISRPGPRVLDAARMLSAYVS